MSLRGSVQHFPLDTVLVLLSETGKTGRLVVSGDEGSGAVELSQGKLVSAEFGGARDASALAGVFTVLRGAFEFTPTDEVARGGLAGDLDDLIAAAVAERDRIAQVREVIPHDGVRFRLSERAAQGGQIVLAPDQWRALLAAESGDVAQVAERLGRPRHEAGALLAELVRMGMIDTVDSLPTERAAGGPGSLPMRTAGPLLLSGELAEFPLETVVQLVGATRHTGRIDVRSSDGASTLAMSDGALISASSDEERGELALADALSARDGDFDFIATSDIPAADLEGGTVELLEQAVELRDRIASARDVVPTTRARPVLSERASGQPQITLSADQWRALTKIDGRRSVGQLATDLGMGRVRATMLVADLVRGGLVDLGEPEVEVAPRAEAWAAAPPVTEVPAPPADLAAAEPEAPLAETRVDEAAREAATDDRLAALTGLFGPAEPAPPPAAWEPPPAETPTEAPPSEWAPPSWEAPAEAPPPAADEAPTAEIDLRLAAFSSPAPPVAEPPAGGALAGTMPSPLPGTMPSPLPGTMASPLAGTAAAPVAEPPPAAPLPGTAAAPVARPPTPSAVAPPPAAPAKKKGGLFGFGAKAEAAAAPAVQGSRSAQIATFANELVAAYNSGEYGKARVEDHMLSLLMRVDEQADPIDRPLPLANDRIDVDSLDRGTFPETQAVPYLALLVRQIYEDAERALGKDKAKKGFRDTRDRLFGKDAPVLQAPEVATRLPKV